jgi:hypothetical protein
LICAVSRDGNEAMRERNLNANLKTYLENESTHNKYIPIAYQLESKKEGIVFQATVTTYTKSTTNTHHSE